MLDLVLSSACQRKPGLVSLGGVSLGAGCGPGVVLACSLHRRGAWSKSELRTAPTSWLLGALWLALGAGDILLPSSPGFL